MTVDYSTILAAVSAGGSSALSSVTLLRAAAGAQATVTPAKYVSARSKESVYLYDTRYIDGEPLRTVLIDSSQSQANRIEQALTDAITDGHPLLRRIPRVRVTYSREGQTEEYTDLTLPHRAFDGHIRAGTVDGIPTTQTQIYRAARNASPANARPLFNLSPISLVLGAWDSSRRARQGRWPSAVTSEIVGVLADQQLDVRNTPRKGGARIDPVGMSVQLPGHALAELAHAQRGELSSTTYSKLAPSAQRLKPGEVESASSLGLGGIPPALDTLSGIACSTIIRSRVLSFATFRQIRFGADAQGDAACRAVLAALALNGIARADAELYLRAYCHLVEAGPSVTELDLRAGETQAVVLPSIEEADAILEEAFAGAKEHAGVDWNGQILEVRGNPVVIEGRVDESAD
ncbi:type I-U CRISPR-associated RAMP protein Csb1/Cas7u [Arthrobacter sp. ov118]|uniref:type I-G CRISPR-associated RAMP protein Csb1/Cas7g n=1 Tax=Arthrobacter sp. ov118 TaxID=1761747 RepID=UPI0008EB7279|nr:type I-U CRISPR-associated RAMP protein Csb1/Cas7u [Arthrobacter sp. ov118]SFU16279.1 CRISPR-associated protein Csb1 [Arthrobacter sp. ov118]